MKRALLCIFILATIATGSATADSIDWRLMRTKHFVIYYSGNDHSTAVRAGEIAEKWRQTISRKMKYDLRGAVPVYLYPNRPSFAKSLDISPTDATVGLTHSELLDIRVDASGAFADIGRIIPHELVHIFVSQKLGATFMRLPLWMHEGLAKFLADDWSDADADLLADAATGSGLIPLGQLADSFPEDRRGRAIAYVESYSAVSFMAKKFTPQSLNDLLDELRKGELFPVAMKYSIGEGPDEFEKEWQQYIRQEYYSARWTRFGGAVVWFLMALFAILAFRRRLLQKRRREREYEAEEES